ncbi:MAG TPA: MFS transporter [Aestuariivirga sp.]|jgi:MFS family permease|nr:MFS transporter [Hyphomicrobiales bacterium]MBP9173275.1 MFS transporter [Hyphomicrobiales bacterium]MCC7481837.1 MFS transporter [Hyphomicrobiales bacterium]HQY72636.1 MFS transporter [Aestuariivirga sp.]HRA92940.1 MFS transporter [Aestuariivirga sp.]
MTSPDPPALPSSNALHHRPYVFYLAALGSAGFAVQIMSVAVGWQVYDLTRNPLDLGFVGLAQFMPALLLVLVTGLIADKFNRRLIIALCLLVEVACAFGLLVFTFSNFKDVWPVFVILVGFGTARAFMNPAADALAPNLLPKNALAHGISLNSMTWQITTITGPVAGGLLYGISGEFAYGVAVGLMIVAICCVVLIGRVPQANHAQETSLATLLAGFKFIRSEKIVLGAISLDLFAVLLGGAVALLPVYARDILDVGPWGLGLLRAGPGIGAILMAIWLSKYPIKDHAGVILFVFVAGFGFCTIVFGLSKSVPLSIIALALMGACDMVSVYVRETLMQLWTPDAVRGRVNAVNRVFIGASNELGEFRAGVVAAWIGAVAAVAIGGAGTMAVAFFWSRWFPELREARTLSGKG